MKKKRGRMKMIEIKSEIDNVNHPQHYADSCSIECIDAMALAWGFDYTAIYCQINAFKYLWRWKNKNGIEDLDKAEWYLNKSDELNNVFGSNSDEITEKNLQLNEMLTKARESLELQPEELDIDEDFDSLDEPIVI